MSCGCSSYPNCDCPENGRGLDQYIAAGSGAQSASGSDCGCPGFSMSDDVNPNYQTCTVCNGDKSDPCNVWYVNGVCKLDQLTYCQVWAVLERVPRAKADLLKITTDPTLISLANDSRLVSDEIESDQAAADMINKGKGTGAGTLPFYTVLRGNTDGSIT
jgi:hypothetical protein